MDEAAVKLTTACNNCFVLARISRATCDNNTLLRKDCENVTLMARGKDAKADR